MAVLAIQAGRVAATASIRSSELASPETRAVMASARTLRGRPVILAPKVGVRAAMRQAGSMACLRKLIHFP